MGKINNPAVFNWLPVFNEIAKGCDVTLPVSTVDDFCFVLNSRFEDARRAKSCALYYRYSITGTSKPTFFNLLKRKPKPTKLNTPLKLLMLQQSLGVRAHSVAKTIILMPTAALEPQSSQTIRTDAISGLRPIVGWWEPSELEIGSPISKNFNRWTVVGSVSISGQAGRAN